MVRGLSDPTQPNPGFRESARATLRLSRARGRAECDALGALFLHVTDDAEAALPRLSHHDARCLLILDLLAIAGTPDAQVVMRRLLALPITRTNGRTFSRFVQRLGFVERPNEATLGYMMNLYMEARAASASDVRAACAYALGASIGRGHVWGLEEAASRAADVLRADLLGAQTTADKCALIAALGHAALESDVPVLLRFVVDGDPQVRATAVLALRKLHTPEARIWLLSAVGGADPELADSALSALFEHSLEPDELVRLAELVLAARTQPALDARILRLLGRHKLGMASTPESGSENGPENGPSERRLLVEDAVQLLMHRVEMPAPHPSEHRVSSSPGRMELSEESGEYARYANATQRPTASTTPFPRSIFPSAAPEATGARVPSIPPLPPLSFAEEPSLRPSRPPVRTFRSAAEALQSCIKKTSRPPPAATPASESSDDVGSPTCDLESAPSEVRPVALPYTGRGNGSVHAFSRPIIPIAKIQ